MNARAGKVLAMGTSALEHGRAHPDSDGGFTLSLAKLEALVARGREAATAQREATVSRRAAVKLKRALRRAMLGGPIPHLAGVGEIAAKDHTELASTFLVKPGVGTYARFLATARAMYNAAIANKDVLAKYGASESVIEEFGTQLDQFEAAMLSGETARTAASGAVFELRDATKQILQTVRVMDGRNRQRFANDPQALGSWISARQVSRAPKPSEPAPTDTAPTPGTPPAQEGGTPGGGVSPAA
jgi:hypothetical protein